MLRVGQIVKSIAGHDQGRFYVIIAVEKNRVAIADGKLRKLEKPKAKNTLHVSPTASELDLAAVTTDKKLREALRAFTVGEEGGF